MILIDSIRISGFRGISSLELSLRPMTVLLGTNNAGKTSILKALQLAVGDYSRYLSDEDFFIGLDGRKASEIFVDLRVVPVDDSGARALTFTESWATEFGDKIKSEADGKQFVALRTRSRQNQTKGGFDTTRYSMERWTAFENWTSERNRETRLNSRLLCIPVIPIEAQRDIHYELRERSSFVGRVLSGVTYDDDEVRALEELIREVNDQAVEKSAELTLLKQHLSGLAMSFSGGGSAELNPLPKKVRDLSKNFSVSFGDSAESTFSMEYHGMGTRSWASLLTVKAFAEIACGKHEREAEPFFPIITAEEPEAHLHPNAQRTLYRQLSSTPGQVIVSTHSPYLAGMADIMNIRSVSRAANGCKVSQVAYKMTPDERNMLSREIINKRADILFSKALILCEGVTEEQIIPSLFEIYSGVSMCELGVSCISVGGKTYAPFIKLACSLGIPVYIVSDNDGNTQVEIESQLRNVKEESLLELGEDLFGVSYLGAGNDFEAEIFSSLGLKSEVIEALVKCETKGSDNVRWVNAKHTEISALSDIELLTKMGGLKASYSGFLGDVLIKNDAGRTKEQRIPRAVLDAFDNIKEWLRYD
ncbi:MAG: AAA family ATPase [Pseudomonas mandelii]